MEVNVFDEFYNNKILGQSWGNCVKEYYLTFSSLGKHDWITMLEFCMFGDPTLVIEDGENPGARLVNRPLPRLIERIIDRFPHLERLLSLIQELR